MARDSLVEGRSEEAGRGVALGSEVLEGSGSCEVFSERVPTEMSFFQELFNMLGSRATSSSLEKTTSSKERDDREHFGGSSEFDNREKISEVVTEDVTGDGDGTLSGSASLHA